MIMEGIGGVFFWGRRGQKISLEASLSSGTHEQVQAVLPSPLAGSTAFRYAIWSQKQAPGSQSQTHSTLGVSCPPQLEAPSAEGQAALGAISSPKRQPMSVKCGQESPLTAYKLSSLCRGENCQLRQDEGKKKAVGEREASLLTWKRQSKGRAGAQSQQHTRLPSVRRWMERSQDSGTHSSSLRWASWEQYSPM